MGKLQYANYESIVDTIYIMGNIALKFHVPLHYKDKNGVRRPIQWEYSYHSPKYGEEITNIYRTMNFYVTIDNIRGDMNFDKKSIMILPQDMIFLRRLLNAMEELSNIAFTRNGNGKLELSTNENDCVQDLFNGKALHMKPTIIKRDDMQFPGVTITLVETGNTTDVLMDQFMGFKYIIDTFDMYGYAINILNYIKPNFGENVNNNMNVNKSPFR